MNVQRAFKRNKISNPLHIAANGLEALRMLRGRDGPTSGSPRKAVDPAGLKHAQDGWH